ncbi:MAG TPA: carboxypeptidase-like regulatory domain-containing protein [Gemmataceae bacterium]|nr:carboxypeptidase-like regulatory domain-containing protein [Gemmataceae bacterium]
MTGKVTYQGKALPGGFITFVRDAGGSYSQKIEKDGTYRVPGVPTGPAKISVRALEPPRHPEGMIPPSEIAKMGKGGVKPPTPTETYVRIPEKYGDAEKSGLTLDVKSGTQTFDIPLK